MTHWFHKWSNWRDVAKADDGDLLQQRECSVCGRKQRKWSYAW